MKLLAIHSDSINVESKKQAIPQAEKIDVEVLSMKDCLVAFFSAEKDDEANPSSVAQQLASETKKIAQDLKITNVMLYPYVHLTSTPSNPKTALTILQEAEKELTKEYNVKHAPFGWYKAFTIATKGHPMSELSRTFGPTEKGSQEDAQESEALKKEDKITSQWFVMTVDGELKKYEDFDFKEHKNLKIFSGYERNKNRDADKEPLHIPAMKRMELADNEPASDGGNMRYYPKGKLIKSLLERHVTQKIVDYGGVEVETPLMYDINHPTLCKYLNRFPARQYNIGSDNRTFFLRFAACFGQFLMAKDATISYKNLPLRLYELTRYSFRREQSGELAGLRRLRAFTMPDCHALCSDYEQAMKEYMVRLKLALKMQEDFGIERKDLELAVRVTKEFYENNKAFVQNLVKEFGKPALIEMWDERIFYFVLKYELNFVDSVHKAVALTTDQIDIENGPQYGIEFTDSDGSKKNPIILHLSPSGAIERVIYAMLEQQLMKQHRGEGQAQFPLWLAPTQVRIIPVREEHHEAAMKLVEELRDQNIRCDIDDRNISLGKRVRQAEKDWSAYTIVIGDEEIKTRSYPVRIRGKEGQETMNLKNLANTIKEETKKKIFQQLPLPARLSQRPIFFG